MVQPLQSGFKTIPKSFTESAYLLGKSKFTTLLKVELPIIKSSVLTAIILTFAHTVGEFGVVLMVGGNIPNQTKVASIAIYDEVEALNYNNAHLYAGILLIVSFSILLMLYFQNNKSSKK
jgi:molybdate transport system permease protein